MHVIQLQLHKQTTNVTTRVRQTEKNKTSTQFRKYSKRNTCRIMCYNNVRKVLCLYDS